MSLRKLLLFPALHTLGCQHSFNTPAASFDLNKLILPSGHYNATDLYFYSSSGNRRFSYYFNVCGNVSSPHPKCESDGETAAYQILNTTDGNVTECWKLGRSEDKTWTYIEGDNAAVGVQLTYGSGIACKDAPGKNRKFTMEFSCVHELSALPPISTVHEDQFCDYKVVIQSIWGCPTECHSADHTGVCSGHGICAVDTTSKRSRCFCNLGKGGPDCSQDVAIESASSSKLTAILATLVILLLMALFGLAGVLYVRIKKLNSDDNPYGAFDDQHGKSDGL